MYLLDTNVVSELRQPQKAAVPVRNWAARAQGAHFYLSVITLLEIEKGVLLAQRRDKAQALSLRTWLETDVIPKFGERILTIDMAVALRCAALHVPDPLPDRDALIAATALVHGMTVVTRNVRDFEVTGVPLLNPWDGGT
jgi:predicted nucleic acid-binding protein